MAKGKPLDKEKWQLLIRKYQTNERKRVPKNNEHLLTY